MESLSILARRALQQNRCLPNSKSLLQRSRITQQSRSLASLRSLPRRQSSSFRPLDHRLSRCSKRHNTSITTSGSNPVEPPTDLRPAYLLTFTCKPCSSRSTHRVTKQGYHHGTVLISCPSCKNRHLIADHMKIFSDKGGTLEQILASANADGKLSALVKKGKLGIRQGAMAGNEGEEDVEFWDDGTESTHQKPKS